MRYARVENGEVKEIIDFDPVGRFHPDIASQFIPCDETVQHKDKHNNGSFARPTPQAHVPKKDKVTKLIDKLVEKGILVEGEVE